MNRFLAIDVGAESGSVMAVELTERGITPDQTRRFPNGPIRALGSLFCDPLCLFGNSMPL